MLHENSGEGKRILPEESESVQKIVKMALERRRQVILYGLSRKLLQCFLNQDIPQQSSEFVDQESWIKIESLSQLRATVGGRFQNLKAKWLKAGFPLREHRGDRVGKANFDQNGWLELSVWINKQGFELRLAEESQPWLFEVKNIQEPPE